MKLQVVVEQDEAGYFVAEVPALPGCLSQGKTHDEAIANVKEAVEGWLEVMFVSSRFGSFSTTSMDESSINSASATSPA